MKFKFQKPFTGIDIDGTSVKMVQVLKEKKIWRLINCKSITLPTDVLELSYKEENIIEPSLFRDTIQEVLKSTKNRVSRIGLSLPNEIIKVTIHRFNGLRESEAKIEQLIRWKEKASLPFPIEKAKISTSIFTHKDTGERSYLTAIAFSDVITDYELHFKRLKINPELIHPSGINQINFYISRLESSGITSFLGLFEKYFTFFVFEDSQLIFFRGKRRSFSFVHFLQEIDMTIELFKRDYPTKEIEKLYFGSQVGLSQDLEQEIKEYTYMDFMVLDESEIILMDEGLDDHGKKIDIAYYASAIGAAQSLAH